MEGSPIYKTIDIGICSCRGFPWLLSPHDERLAPGSLRGSKAVACFGFVVPVCLNVRGGVCADAISLFFCWLGLLACSRRAERQSCRPTNRPTDRLDRHSRNGSIEHCQSRSPGRPHAFAWNTCVLGGMCAVADLFCFALSLSLSLSLYLNINLHVDTL